MWFENNFRRHLCDMHIDDWDEQFLSRFSPEEYVQNLKTAKIKSAMLYLQSHVGLCYYPTKSGKIHNGFIGKEDAMLRLVKLCREAGIATTGYYSLIYNTWAHDLHPQWRMVSQEGKSRREAAGDVEEMEFSDKSKQARYGLCCPNNMEYRAFVEEQIKEIAEYFPVDGMFYDMLFWPHLCYCESCQKRWAEEVGGELPLHCDWSDPKWLLHIHKRRQWMGEFAQWATDLTKALMPGVSVQHNVSQAALPSQLSSCAEEVVAACDYAGGDLYRGGYGHTFACKFYRSITRYQPFEYMFSRCAPNLAAHTQIKSRDIMRSEVFQTAANHGATLVIDAIDPVGTMDKRVYQQIGDVFDELIPYEPYLVGKPIEDVGLYYSLKSRFNAHGEIYTNFEGVTNALQTMIENNILCGITGGFHSLDKYKVLVAPALTQMDVYDNQRLIDYVKNGGCLYFSGGDNPALVEEFFHGQIAGRTKEQVVYLAPKDAAQNCFDYFNEDRPLNFNGSAPIVQGIDPDSVLATLTLPYTHQNTKKFASIHSNPPGIKTDIPAMAVTKYGKGTVLWSAVAIECIELYEHRQIFADILKQFFCLRSTIISDAPKDVEVTVFKTDHSLLVNTVLINHDRNARKVEDFTVSVVCDQPPKALALLPQGTDQDCTICANTISFRVSSMGIFKMFEIRF